MYFSIVLQRSAERPERSQPHNASVDAMPCGLERLVGQYGQRIRLLFAVSILLHRPGWKNYKSVKAEPPRLNGQHRRFEQKVLRPDGGHKGAGDKRQTQQRSRQNQRQTFVGENLPLTSVIKNGSGLKARRKEEVTPRIRPYILYVR